MMVVATYMMGGKAAQAEDVLSPSDIALVGLKLCRTMLDGMQKKWGFMQPFYRGRRRELGDIHMQSTRLRTSILPSLTTNAPEVPHVAATHRIEDLRHHLMELLDEL